MCVSSIRASTFSTPIWPILSSLDGWISSMTDPNRMMTKDMGRRWLGFSLPRISYEALHRTSIYTSPRPSKRQVREPILTSLRPLIGVWIVEWTSFPLVSVAGKESISLSSKLMNSKVLLTKPSIRVSMWSLLQATMVVLMTMGMWQAPAVLMMSSA